MSHSMQHVYICPDCNQPCATVPDSLCANCAEWRKSKFAEMDVNWQQAMARRERRRMPSGQRFAEGLADMVKAVERSRR